MYSSSAYQKAEDRAGLPVPPPQTILITSYLRWYFILVRPLCVFWTWYYLILPWVLFSLSIRLLFEVGSVLRISVADLEPAYWFTNLMRQEAFRQAYISTALRLCSALGFRWQSSEFFWAFYFIIADRHTFHEDVSESLRRTLGKKVTPSSHRDMVFLYVHR